MIILDRPFGNSLPVSRGIFTRELAPRQDNRLAEERMDMPEIQDSFRVSFSDAVLTRRYEKLRDEEQATTPVDARSSADPRLRAYLMIEAL